VGLVGGVLGQIVLGGITVLFDLAPPLVMAHFSLSMAILACAVVLHHRAGRPDAARPVSVVDGSLVRMGGLLIAAAALVVFLGTVVTGSGPHPGSSGDQIVDRLPFDLHTVARLHGIAVMIFLGFVVVTVGALAQARAPRAVLHRAEALLAVLVAQAGVGYAQYFLGVPALLVGVHIAGATAAWGTTLWFRLGLTEWAPVEPMVAGVAAPSQVLAPT
jgi:cytochrome c oxidase assembly protein subunit 15